MIQFKFSLFFFSLVLSGCFSHSGNHTRKQSEKVLLSEELVFQDPLEIYGDLFKQVQLLPLHSDSKWFVDLLPQGDPLAILKKYKLKSPQSKEELQSFINENFYFPEVKQIEFKIKQGEDINAHILRLWTYLTRSSDQDVVAASSLIPLPYSYVVPGGRFREIYYWDSYFTSLGLVVDHQDELFKNMVRNFAHLVLSIGRIPNGNRDYYRSRSQPPFFSHMVKLWESQYGISSALTFLPALKKEYEFWMTHSDRVQPGEADLRVVGLRGGVLNRYWDDKDTPRPEAYKEDVALAQQAQLQRHRSKEEVFRDLRAGAESGWDFSTRWFADPQEFASVQTSAYVPIDLNALLYHLELLLSHFCKVQGESGEAKAFAEKAQVRARLVREYLWDEKSGTFRDYNWRRGQVSPEETVAMVVPLFTGLATPHQAQRVAQNLRLKFLHAGGLVTTLRRSGQQWDSPNGWPPHQWMAYMGLRRYGINDLSDEIKTRWLQLNQKVYRSTGKLMEKYNVMDLSLPAGGGEYPLQDGFGWTNGVYKALSHPLWN